MGGPHQPAPGNLTASFGPLHSRGRHSHRQLHAHIKKNKTNIQNEKNHRSSTRACGFRCVSSEAMHVSGVIGKSLKDSVEVPRTKGAYTRKHKRTQCVFLRELSGPVVAHALHPGVNYPQGEAGFLLTGSQRKASVRQATWRTGCESLNRSSAAFFTTKVNNKRVLMQERLMSKCTVPVCGRQVEARSNN